MTLDYLVHPMSSQGSILKGSEEGVQWRQRLGERLEDAAGFEDGGRNVGACGSWKGKEADSPPEASRRNAALPTSSF